MPAVPAMSLASGRSGLLQRKNARASAHSQSSLEAPPVVHDVLRSPGQPLDAASRAFMEPRFGYDFSRVRVHADSRAAQSAEAVNAQAYTVGSNIVFGANKGGAGNLSHQRLLAHELAHVVQQGGRQPGGSLQVASANDSAEGAADRAADQALSGGRTQTNVLVGTGPRLARKAQQGCDSKNDEGKPLIWFDRAAPARSWRPATGYAQKKLNEQIGIIEASFMDTAKWQSIPQANRDFILDELDKVTYPLVVDCKFGEQTERATKIVQAYNFKDRKEWDGMIGPKTWPVVDQRKVTPPSPYTPIPNVPFPVPPGTTPIPNRPPDPPRTPIDL
jgi:hypothetical protein